MTKATYTFIKNGAPQKKITVDQEGTVTSGEIPSDINVPEGISVGDYLNYRANSLGNILNLEKTKTGIKEEIWNLREISK